METEVSDLKIEGTIYTVCPQTSLVVVLTGSPPSTFHVLSIASLSSFTLLSLPKTPQPGQSSLTPINIRTLSDRANNILLREKEKAAKLNQGVDKTTQDLFDGLDKQFSARWKGRDIIVMERVVVKGPGYRNEDCKVITKDGEGLLSRVKKVVSLQNPNGSTTGIMLIEMSSWRMKGGELCRERAEGPSNQQSRIFRLLCLHRKARKKEVDGPTHAEQSCKA